MPTGGKEIPVNRVAEGKKSPFNKATSIVKTALQLTNRNNKYSESRSKTINRSRNKRRKHSEARSQSGHLYRKLVQN